MNLLERFFPYDHRPEHNRALDGLRGLAVLLVLFGHATNQGLTPWLEGTLLARGKLGVYLFFLISAYLLDKQIIQVWQQGKGNWNYWRYYIGRRIMRIFPPFLLALITFRLMNEAEYNVVIREWSHVWEHLALIRGDHIFWSIPTEFRYYILSPLLLLFCYRFLKFHPTKTLVLLNVLFVLFANLAMSVDWPRHSTLRYLSIFLVGTFMAAWEMLQPKSFDTIKNHKALNAVGVLAIVGFGVWGSMAEDFTAPWVYPPAAFLWSILLLWSFQKSFWGQFLSLKLLRFIGTISYSLYLFHIPVLMWVKSLDLNNAVAFPAFLALSIVVAALLHLLVERPALSLVKK